MQIYEIILYNIKLYGLISEKTNFQVNQHFADACQFGLFFVAKFFSFSKTTLP